MIQMAWREVRAAADHCGKLRLRLFNFSFGRQFACEQISSLPEIGVHEYSRVKIIQGFLAVTLRNQTNSAIQIVRRPVRLMIRGRLVVTDGLIPFSFILLHESPVLIS